MLAGLSEARRDLLIEAVGKSVSVAYAYKVEAGGADRSPAAEAAAAPSLSSRRKREGHPREARHHYVILVLLSAAGEARYLLDAQGRWVKCGADERVCQMLQPPSTTPLQPVPSVPSVIHPKPAPLRHFKSLIAHRSPLLRRMMPGHRRPAGWAAEHLSEGAEHGIVPSRLLPQGRG